MYNTHDILETIKMIEDEHLDIRTVTMGISLLDCIDNDILSVVENYPPQVLRLLMNHIGTHDTERAVTHLSGKYREYFSRDEQAKFTLNSEERVIAHKRMKLATLLQFTLPGVPSQWPNKSFSPHHCGTYRSDEPKPYWFWQTPPIH